MIVATSSGPVRGAEEGGVARFLGVPYAAAPVGDLRFLAPRPHAGWTEPLDATRHGATAPQAPYRGVMGEILPSVDVPGDEILHLAIWAPDPAPAAGAPVLVWIHGGSLAHGSNAIPAYDGTAFARDGVVLVGVNYRVGAEGFSVLDGADANPGLHDVLAAIRWVHREIAAFGGDPARITIAGQSAGGNLVAAVLASGAVDDLVAGAVILSGPPSARSPKAAGRISRAIAARLRRPATREAFAAVPPAELVAAQEAATAGSTPVTGGPGYSLVIDPALVPVTPEAALVDGAAAGIPLLIGWTSEEARLWLVPTGLEASIGRGHLLGARIAFRIRRATVAAYRRAMPGASRGALFGALARDLLLTGPALRIAQARAARGGAGTWISEFDWRSPAHDLGAAHAVDLPFVFDRVDAPDSVGLIGDAAPASLAAVVHGDVVRFATDGDPGWPAWGPDELVRVYDADGARVAPLPRADLWRAWG